MLRMTERVKGKIKAELVKEAEQMSKPQRELCAVVNWLQK